MLSPPFIMYYMGCCNDCLTCDIAFNAVMPLSRASTRGSYSRIEGVTVCSHAVPHVSENASGPTEPAHLSPRRAGDEKQIQERFSVAALGVTQE